MTGSSIAAVRVRLEGPDDKADIRYVNVLAFDRTAEADAVDALRTAGAVTLSMVAVVDAETVGHALVTPATVATDRGEMPLLGLRSP